jgi:hypothetical protein
MRFLFLKLSAAAALSLGLSACAVAPMVPRDSFIQTVTIDARPDSGAAGMVERVAAETRREASRFGQQGAAKELKISLTALRYRNAVRSALIGDANSLEAQVVVRDVATGQQQGEFKAQAIVTPGGGLTGVFLAAFESKEWVDGLLVRDVTSDILTKVYGSEAAQAARSRPIAGSPQAVPAPAAAPEPAPRVTPTKARPKEDKTAMAAFPDPVPFPIAR